METDELSGIPDDYEMHIHEERDGSMRGTVTANGKTFKVNVNSRGMDIEPDHRCPPGYEYVKGHRRLGHWVKGHCARIGKHARR